jgi:preprotein translocase subunit SecB
MLQPESPKSEQSVIDQIATGGRVAANCQIIDIRPTNFGAELFKIPSGPCTVRIDAEPSFMRTSDRLTYELKFAVTVLDEVENIAKVNVNYVATFLAPENFEAENDEYTSFGQITVYMAIYPYLRELVQSCAARLGIGGLVLGVARQPAAAMLQHVTARKQSGSTPSKQTAKTARSSRTK